MLDYSKILISYGRFCKDSDLSLMCGMLVIMIYKSWVFDGEGINRSSLVKALNYKDGSLLNIRFKLQLLMDLGFVEIVGTGRNHSQLFGPTDYCCALLESSFGPIEGSDNKSADSVQ